MNWNYLTNNHAHSLFRCLRWSGSLGYTLAVCSLLGAISCFCPYCWCRNRRWTICYWGDLTDGPTSLLWFSSFSAHFPPHRYADLLLPSLTHTVQVDGEWAASFSCFACCGPLRTCIFCPCLSWTRCSLSSRKILTFWPTWVPFPPLDLCLLLWFLVNGCLIIRLVVGTFHCVSWGIPRVDACSGVRRAVIWTFIIGWSLSAISLESVSYPRPTYTINCRIVSAAKAVAESCLWSLAQNYSGLCLACSRPAHCPSCSSQTESVHVFFSL